MKNVWSLSLFFMLTCPAIYAQYANPSVAADTTALPTQASITPPHFNLRNEHTALGRKFLRAEVYNLSGQVALMGILTAVPSSVSNWKKGYLKDSFKNIKRAFTTAPVWDHDAFIINYVGHTYTGVYYYNSVRSQGATKLQSFLYSVLQSTFFEYVIEAVAERPSKQDLLVTPLLGSVTGELINRATIRMRRNGFSFIEKVVVFIINPTYVFNNGFRRF